MAAAALILALLLPVAQASTASPVDKVLQLLADLQAKVVDEGKAAQKTYEEFAEWCEERSKDLQFEIKTGQNEAAELQATIDKEDSAIGAFNAKIEELSAALAIDEADLKAATEIRSKEKADFDAEDKELTDIVSMLERALAILEREMAKAGASMLQMKNAQSIAEALGVMVQASAMSSADAGRLTALVQSAQSAQSNDEGVGAPDAAVYEGHSGDIIDTLQGLLDKAESQLATARKTETANVQNYQMLKQSLEDEIKFGNDDLAKAKNGLSTSAGSKATAAGALDVTSKDVAADTASLADLHQLCMTKSNDFEAAVKSRNEELEALAHAKKAVAESTAGAADSTYGLAQVSFVQLSTTSASAGRFIWDLAQKQSSPALAQLASRISTVLKSEQDPFGKIKGLIADMIARLEDEADADASHKAYCDKELGETNAKHADKTAAIAKLTAAIDKASARSAKLKEEVARLQKELAELASSQVEMDKLREEENADYKKNRADLEQGVAGVKIALKVLREYYAKDDKAHESAEGAGQGIIGLLEVIESDFTKGLAEAISTEEASATEYDQQTKQNQVDKTAKYQDVKYKTKEAADLDKAVKEDTADRSGVQAELDALNEYLDSLHSKCDEVAEPYAERKRRREAEIAGLKEALTILEGPASLLQKDAHRTLRGLRRH